MNIGLKTVSAAELGLSKTWDASLLPDAPLRLSVLGDPALLGGDKVGLFCSVRCPGDLILRAYDFAKKLRDDAVTVIGGFHSPVEKECLRILLRGTKPVIICPARSIANMRPREFRQGIDRGRLLLMSPFAGSRNRSTAELARERNRFVAAVADKVCFIYTTPGGTLESFANDLHNAGRAVMGRFAMEPALEVILLTTSGRKDTPLEGIVTQWDAARYPA